mmetsp:Transcript_11606/g.22840  ORF Transcript_11606/g.22840 Transcript_11606/m.22840 type:complete len:721 (-) Transcript_11606:298-2460(-)|eukprot:CAMPEP_0171495844 /NCGR_PEP_ID=MMETSP0958-20121227/6365_1 /TAXON_ID=87120 /ORGANISM="Aurantiochytrium limacinum, Strain ATCCMYA-1381" /LENGTH=720 /DNA_ID=CAMNT_0012029867 /DNA_START=517 /DNA_END=2679 /DNA_ORIENTATION=-
MMLERRSRQERWSEGDESGGDAWYSRQQQKLQQQQQQNGVHMHHHHALGAGKRRGRRPSEASSGSILMHAKYSGDKGDNDEMLRAVFPRRSAAVAYWNRFIDTQVAQELTLRASLQLHPRHSSAILLRLRMTHIEGAEQSWEIVRSVQEFRALDRDLIKMKLPVPRFPDTNTLEKAPAHVILCALTDWLDGILACWQREDRWARVLYFRRFRKGRNQHLGRIAQYLETFLFNHGSDINSFRTLLQKSSVSPLAETLERFQCLYAMNRHDADVTLAAQKLERLERGLWHVIEEEDEGDSIDSPAENPAETTYKRFAIPHVQPGITSPASATPSSDNEEVPGLTPAPSFRNLQWLAKAAQSSDEDDDEDEARDNSRSRSSSSLIKSKPHPSAAKLSASGSRVHHDEEEVDEEHKLHSHEPLRSRRGIDLSAEKATAQAVAQEQNMAADHRKYSASSVHSHGPRGQCAMDDDDDDARSVQSLRSYRSYRSMRSARSRGSRRTRQNSDASMFSAGSGLFHLRFTNKKSSYASIVDGDTFDLDMLSLDDYEDDEDDEYYDDEDFDDDDLLSHADECTHGVVTGLAYNDCYSDYDDDDDEELTSIYASCQAQKQNTMVSLDHIRPHEVGRTINYHITHRAPAGKPSCFALFNATVLFDRSPDRDCWSPVSIPDTPAAKTGFFRHMNNYTGQVLGQASVQLKPCTSNNALAKQDQDLMQEGEATAIN